MTRQPVFSPALFAHFLRRFWPFMAAVAVLLALHAAGLASVVTFTLGLAGGGSAADPVHTAATIQMAAGPWLCAAAAPACLVASLLVFRHLRDRAEMQFYLGLPFSRTCLFLTSHAAALCLVAVPAAAVALIVAAFELAGGLVDALPGLGMAACACACALLLFGGLASLSCVATGRAGGAVLAYACLNVAAIALYGASWNALGQFLVGVPLDSGELVAAVWWLTPAVKLPSSAAASYLGAGEWGGFGDAAALAVYALLGAAITAASWALYRARPAERTGEAMAFAGARVAFQALASLVVASLGTMVVLLGTMRQGVDSSLAARYAVCMVAFAAVGWLAAEMFVRRTPRVFDLRTLAGCASVAGALAVAFALLATDAFGVVRWVPDPADVQRAEVSCPALAEPGVVDPADAVAVHRAVLENRGLLERPAAGYGSYRVRIGYDMADGSHAERSYLVYEPAAPDGEMSSDVWLAAKAALDAPDAVYRAAFGTSRELSQADIDRVDYELQGGYLDTGRPYEYSWAPFGRADAYNLYRAAAQDIREGNASRFSGDEIGSITFKLRPGVADEAPGSGSSSSGGLIENELKVLSQPADDGSFTGTLAITPEMEHTLAWIESFELRADWQDRSQMDTANVEGS